MSSKNTAGFPRLSWKHFQTFLQKISLSLDLFLKNELFNHAGAAAFFFILSIPPVFLLLVIAFDRVLTSYPHASAVFFDFLKAINPNLNRDFLIKVGLLNVKTTAIGVFSLLNLLWAGRAILTSIQRGLGVIFPAEKFRPPLITNIFSFIILSVLLLVSFLITLASIGMHFFQNLLINYAFVQTFLQSLLPIMRRVFPFLIIVLLIFLAYRLVPPKRPQTLPSLVGAIGCTFSIFVLHILFSKFFTVTQYSVIYGVLGSLILMVIWVYFSFVLFFFFAEVTFVFEKIDILVLERMYFFRFQKEIKGKKIQKFLFNRPQNIMEKYTRRFSAGDILFREGDQSQNIYFVDRGMVDIYHDVDGEDRKIASIHPGQVFGEMAYLLDETRTGTAICQTESVLLTITPETFEELLQVNPLFARDVINALCNRLRRTLYADKIC